MFISHKENYFPFSEVGNHLSNTSFNLMKYIICIIYLSHFIHISPFRAGGWEFWRLKMVPILKELTIYNGRRPYWPFKSSRCIEASFYIPESRLNFPTTKGFRMNISMKLVYQYMAIFFTFSPISNHLHPLQVENCDSNSRLVVDEDDNGKFRLERVKHSYSKG